MQDDHGSVGSGLTPLVPSPSASGLIAQPSGADSASVTTSDATCYTVRNGWAWAHIFVRHGVEQGERPRHWVHVATISDYGSFGYCWSHIGEDWRAFLSGLDMHYAMQKFMGEHFRVPLSGIDAQEKGRALVLQDRRDRGLDKADARTLYDAANEADTDDGCRAFLRDWDQRSYGLFYAREYWDGRWDTVNPQALGFWREVWPHFVAALEGVATTPTADGEASKPKARATEPKPSPPSNHTEESKP
jgi:hypothetical protein